MSNVPLLEHKEATAEDSYLDEPIFDHVTPSDTNTLGAVQVLINTAIGSGTLMVPYCYTTGVGFSLIISLIFCFVGIFSQYFFVLSSRFTKKYDYHGLFCATFGEKHVWIVQTMIFLVQFGSCMIYCHWNGRLVPKVIGKSNDTGILGNHPFWIFVLAVTCVFPLVCLRSIKQLEKFAYLSSGCILLLIVHSIYWFFVGLHRHSVDIPSKIVWFKWSPILITCLSVNSMAYNCHMNLFPTLHHLERSTYKRSRSLIIWVMVGAFVLYNLYGVFTYLFLFDSIGKGSALEAYTEKSLFTTLTIGGIVFDLIISVPIVIWAARTSINDMFFGNEPTTLRWVTMGALLTLGTAIFASVSDNVVLFFDVVGGLFTPSLIFLLPCLFYLYNQKGEPYWRIVVACAVSIFSIVATIACTYQAIDEVIDTYRKK